MSLSEETLALQRAAHDLMYLGMDGSPVYSDDLSRRNGEVYRLTTALYNSGIKGSTVEEQANVCLALLMGYSASFVDHGEKRKHIQEVLDRCWDILDALPTSLLKLRLLTACYGEVFDEPLADEGRAIIASWNSVSFTTEQQEAIEEFQNVVDNPYPWEYIEDSASEEVDVKYIKADFRVRHFEDAEVNGILENEKAPLMPFVIGRRWLIEVDIKKGCVLNWPKGVRARVNYKVCDEGIYRIYDSNKKLIKEKEGYVPDIFGQDDTSFGDYVCMSIDDEGLIQNWEVTNAMLEDLLS